MKAPQAILMLVLAATLAGCVLKGKQQTAKNIPPAPLPVAKPEPAPPPAPLSIPQTQIELPPPQPVNAEAAAAAESPSEPVETPTTTTRSSGGTRRAAGAPASTPPRTEPTPPNAPATAPPAAAAPAATPEPPPIQEIVPANEQKHLQELATARKRESRQLLDQAAMRRLNHRETGLKKTIESYLKLSDQAEAKGDMRQAADLAERALTLAKDLQSGR